MLETDIDVVNPFEFKDCRRSGVNIKTDEGEVSVMINIEYSSLELMSEKLFGMVDENLFEDLQKEIANTIGGYFADLVYTKGYELSLPKVYKKCDTNKGLFFSNDILKLCIKLKRIA
jgi:hypothetical protein